MGIKLMQAIYNEKLKTTIIRQIFVWACGIFYNFKLNNFFLVLPNGWFPTPTRVIRVELV